MVAINRGQGEKGDGEDREDGCNHFAHPRLRHDVSIPYGGHCCLKQQRVDLQPQLKLLETLT